MPILDDTIITVYGAEWCPDAKRSRRLLDGKAVTYTWRNIDSDPAAETFVRQANGGSVRIPVIVFPDNTVLIEPSDADLEWKLNELSL